MESLGRISNGVAHWMDSNERWLPIQNYPGYEVSDLGRVRSCRKGCPGGGTYGNFLIKKQVLTSTGYPAVGLWRDNKGSLTKVHHLVLEAFVGPKPSQRHQCRHLDGNPLNSALSNLAWGTVDENVADKSRHGTWLIGSRVPSSNFTETQIGEMHALLREGFTRRQIAARYGIHYKHACELLRGIGYGQKSEAIVTTTNPNAKLTPSQVLDIKALFASGQRTRAELAEAYGVSRLTVQKILTGRSWRHL